MVDVLYLFNFSSLFSAADHCFYSITEYRRGCTLCICLAGFHTSPAPSLRFPHFYPTASVSVKIMTLCEMEFQLFISQPSVIARLSVTHEVSKGCTSNEGYVEQLIQGLNSE